MSPTGKEPKDSAMRLLPHQAALVETFFDRASKRVILLRGDVGLGKGTALVALSGRLLLEEPRARVLFLGPGAIGSQYVDMLRNAGVPAVLVDRYLFREMLDSATEGEIWPRGAVSVLSLDFAKKLDIRDSLAAIRWDLVIVDEAHSLRGGRAEVLRQVGLCAKRIVFATATHPTLETPDVFPGEEPTVVEWRREQVVDENGMPLVLAPRLLLNEVRFSLNPAELSLSETVSTLCRILEDGTPPQVLIANSLRRSLQSSPAALERALRGLTETLEVQDRVPAALEATEDEVPEDVVAEPMDRRTAEKAAGIAERALQEIEAIDADSKLGAFGGLLSHLKELEMPPERICVLTEYLATLYYLAAEIEGRGMVGHVVHGGMSAEDHHRALEMFTGVGGILVITRAVTEGFDLPEVTDLVLYDIPGSGNAQQQLLGRFDRFGRLSQLNIHVLAPSNSSGGSIAEPLTILRGFLGSPTMEEPGR